MTEQTLMEFPSLDVTALKGITSQRTGRLFWEEWAALFDKTELLKTLGPIGQILTLQLFARAHCCCDGAVIQIIQLAADWHTLGEGC